VKHGEGFEQAEFRQALAELRAARRALCAAFNARAFSIVHSMNVHMERAIARLERRHPHG